MNAKEQYIRQVKKALTVPRAKKDEIPRDLQEAFDSALEHGETEQDVIERLGSPAEFAGNIENQRGIKRKRHGKTALIWVLALLSAALFAAYAASRMMLEKDGVYLSIAYSGGTMNLLIMRETL